MDILTVGIVWVALALIVAALLRFAEIVVVVVVVCMLIHILIHIRGKRNDKKMD